MDAEGRVLAGSDTAHLGLDLVNPATMTFTYTGLGQLIASHYAAENDSTFTQYAAAESVTYDPLGNWMTRHNADQWASSYTGTAAGGFTSVGARTATYTTTSGRLHGETLDGSRTDTLAYDAAGNLHATLIVNPGSPSQYNERVSYYALDGRLVAADARSGGGTTALGHTAFEEYRYDALGRRVWVRARRWCSDQSGAGNQGDEVNCDLSTVRRTVWSGSSELAEIQMPGADTTGTALDTLENDTLAVHRQRVAAMADAFYDANRFFGRVFYVLGPGLDQPVAATRVNYADASDLHTGAVSWQAYAPFSLLGLWNNQGGSTAWSMAAPRPPGRRRSAWILERSTEAAEWRESSHFWWYSVARSKLGSWTGTLGRRQSARRASRTATLRREWGRSDTRS